MYHDLGNLNFTIITAAGETAALDLHLFALPVVRALREMGLEAELSGRNDMTVAGKKFSGNAQYVKNGRVMHHGTLMFNSDLDTVAEALNVAPDKIQSKGIKSVPSRVTNLKEHMAEDASLEEFRSRLVENVFKGQEFVKYELRLRTWRRWKSSKVKSTLHGLELRPIAQIYPSQGAQDSGSRACQALY